MTFLRMLAIGVIYLGSAGAWIVLGTAVSIRTADFSGRLGKAVDHLWGGALVQTAPRFVTRMPGTGHERRLAPVRNDLEVDLDLRHRRKGLFWYPTYTAEFQGSWEIVNPDPVAARVRFEFDFPGEGTYDGFRFAVDGQPQAVPVDTRTGVRELIELAPGERRTLSVAYVTRGMGEWRFRPDPQIGRLRNLNLAMTTNFRKVDFPEGGLSPDTMVPEGRGMRLVWTATDQLTRSDIGMIVPDRLNPGPIASRMTFFAPVCLLFFYVLLTAITVVARVPIHPMHYLMTSAGFFAFHLLFAYLVDHIAIHPAFWISAGVAVGMVTLYLRGALGAAFPWKAALGGLLFYLVLFSYSFFFKGSTGLIVTIGSVLTLAVLMRLTLRTDWSTVFRRRAAVTR